MSGLPRGTTVRLALCVIATGGTLLYLAGGIVQALVAGAFYGAIVLPIAVLIAGITTVRRLPPLAGMAVSHIGAVALLVPLFLVRHAVPLPHAAVDALFGIAFMTAAWRTRGRVDWHAAGAALRPASVYLFGVIPLLFSAVWAGMEVRSAVDTRYYGLFPIDFLNLSSIVSLLNAAPGLLRSHVVGAGLLSYHWFYFAAPAWMSGFLGAAIPHTHALALFNLVAAWVLFAATAALAARFVPEQRRGESAGAAAVVLFAPMLLYAYRIVADHGGLRSIAPRIVLVLSPANAMTGFGNHTLALAMAAVLLVALQDWNRDGGAGSLVLVCAALALLIPYSIVLVFPLSLMLAAGILTGRVRAPLLAAGAIGVAGIAAVAGVYALGMLTGGSRAIAPGFDEGRFVQTAAITLLPLWVTAAPAAARRELRWPWTLVAACLLVPTVLQTTGAVARPSDLGMKIATLLCVAMAPPVAAGLQALRGRRRGAAARLVAVALIVLGVAHTAVYALQFVMYRATGRAPFRLTLPVDYHRALLYVRGHTPVDAVVMDAGSLVIRDTLTTVAIGERRAWLPTPYTRLIVNNDAERTPAMLARVERFETWRASGFAEGALARQFAGAADVLLVTETVTSSDWELAARFGAYRIYRSRVRANRPS